MPSRKIEEAGAWTEEEDDLLLFFLHTSYPGGQCKDELSWANIGIGLAAMMIARGENTDKIYEGDLVRLHYETCLKPKYEITASSTAKERWTEEEESLFISLILASPSISHVDTDQNWVDLAYAMNDRATATGINTMSYTAPLLQRRYYEVLGRRVKERAPCATLPHPNPWTKEEDNMLLSLVQEINFGGTSQPVRWKDILDPMIAMAAAAGLNLRTYTATMLRAHYHDKLKPAI